MTRHRSALGEQRFEGVVVGDDRVRASLVAGDRAPEVAVGVGGVGQPEADRERVAGVGGHGDRPRRALAHGLVLCDGGERGPGVGLGDDGDRALALDVGRVDQRPEFLDAVRTLVADRDDPQRHRVPLEGGFQSPGVVGTVRPGVVPEFLPAAGERERGVCHVGSAVPADYQCCRPGRRPTVTSEGIPFLLKIVLIHYILGIFSISSNKSRPD
ncbi:MAG: hypothetical protein ABEH77_00895 [Halobacteriaceae archaeon]